MNTATTNEASTKVMHVLYDPKTTVDETFKYHIEEARKHVEFLCSKRATLETLGLSNYPYQQLRNLLDTFPV